MRSGRNQQIRPAPLLHRRQGESTLITHPCDVPVELAPFADERDRSLRDCAEHGATPGSLRIKRNELVWIATRLDPDAHKGIGIEVLQRIANEGQKLHWAATAARGGGDNGRPGLRFLGWWREPAVVSQYQSQLDRYVTWMRDERGFTLSTVEQWSRTIGRFLRWGEQKNRQLGELRAEEVEHFLLTRG